MKADSCWDFLPTLVPHPSSLLASLSIYWSSGSGLGTRYLDMNETHPFRMLVVQPRERELVIRSIECQVLS